MNIINAQVEVLKEALKNKGASEDINLESLGITKGRRNVWEFITKKPAKIIVNVIAIKNIHVDPTDSLIYPPLIIISITFFIE